MDTKPLLFGLVGFFAGGLLVAVAATTFNKPEPQPVTGMSMSQMTASLNDKQGDDFDEAFIASMIEHHEGAVDMARLSAANAKHDEIRQLSNDIIAAQEKEISQMKQWQHDWGYGMSDGSMQMNH